MCREHRGLIVFASLFGLFQSVLWVAVSAVLILIYYCVISITDYEFKSDFFRVTVVKLYFEGPKCIPDGNYLGKFNEDYRTSITLVGREVFMFALIAYVILSVIYFVLSILLCLKRRRPNRFLTIAWSVITLILCTLDALVTYALVIDSFTLMHYFLEISDVQDVLLGSIPYIPLLLAFASSRFVVVWIWNFFIGIYTLFVGLCGSTVPKSNVQAISLKAENKTADTTMQKVAEKAGEKPKTLGPQRPTEDGDGSISLVSEHVRNSFTSDVMRAYPENGHYRRPMEAVTKFSEEERTPREYHPHNWCYEPPSEMSSNKKSHPKTLRLREETNEGYIDDEEVSRRFDRSIDFEHNLKNFESGQMKIKMMRPHSGKPVAIPVPPPLPPIGSCNC